MAEGRYLSIGEVLGLLLQEFPDITISKIRFLESQGLIEPERTPSGYRKFHDVDVERLRLILRAQREHFLPLKVIKEMLERGELAVDPTGALRRARARLDGNGAADPTPPGGLGMPAPATAAEPAPPPPPASPAGELTAEELCRAAGIGAAFLAELHNYGVLSPARTYDADAVQVALAASRLCARGLQPRHLRAWRTAADKEVALVEQLVAPVLRQRRPEARTQAVALAHEIEALGGELRAALTREALRRLIG